MVSGKVARPWAAGPVGRNSKPFWPQAPSRKTMQIVNASRRVTSLIRIWQTLIMAKL